MAETEGQILSLAAVSPFSFCLAPEAFCVAQETKFKNQCSKYTPAFPSGLLLSTPSTSFISPPRTKNS